MIRRSFLKRLALGVAAAAVLPISALLPKKFSPVGNPIFSGSQISIDGVRISNLRPIRVNEYGKNYVLLLHPEQIAAMKAANLLSASGQFYGADAIPYGGFS